MQLLADLEEAEGAAAASAARPRGTIRLTCAINFGVRHVSGAIGAFLARYPEVRFDVSLADRFVDLVEEGFDLAVRIGGPGGERLVARRLGDTQLVCCAAPAYLKAHGTPRTPEDLARHACLTYEYLPVRGVWEFRDRSGRERRVRVSGPLHANHGDLLVAAAVQGAGIALEPDFIAGDDLRAGRLVRILDAFSAPVSTIYAVYPSRRHLSAKVRAFVDFLASRFGAQA